MQRADEPPQRDVVIKGLEAAPGFSGRRHISQRQQDTGDDLKTEDGQRRAAEYVPPARSIAWNRMFRRLANGRRELQTVVEPFTESRDQAHGGSFRRRAAPG